MSNTQLHTKYKYVSFQFSLLDVHDDTFNIDEKTDILTVNKNQYVKQGEIGEFMLMAAKNWSDLKKDKSLQPAVADDFTILTVKVISCNEKCTKYKILERFPLKFSAFEED